MIEILTTIHVIWLKISRGN